MSKRIFLYGTLHRRSHHAKTPSPRAGTRTALKRTILASFGISRLRGRKLFITICYIFLAEACYREGKPEEGLRAIAEALGVMSQTEEHWFESELLRLKGELSLQQSSQNGLEAEHAFQQSLAITRSQSAKALELRTATSLVRLWQSQGKTIEAHGLLTPVYHWFTEGFDTPDLKDAKSLLNELSEGV